MSDLGVDAATLLLAAGAWGEQADQLRGAVASLDEVSSLAVGPHASGALADFCRHWSQRLATMQGTAQDHASALSSVVDLTLSVDEEQAAGLTGLLPAP